MEKKRVKIYTLLDIPQIEGKYSTIGEGWMDGKIELHKGKQFFNAATIMRAKPPHRNHIAMLEALCQKSEHLTINIGSANVLDHKNPFYPHETEEMLRLGLKNYDNYNIIPIPDFYDKVKGDGSGDRKWTEYLFEKNPDFTEFISNNDWVTDLLKPRQYKDGYKQFDIIFPPQILPEKDMLYVNGIYICATEVRKAMVNNGEWEQFLLPDIADYIKENNLVERVKKLCKGKV
jgi:nicotinamide mononucleotide adenylyltransferase